MLRSSFVAPGILAAGTLCLFILGPGSMDVPPMDDTYIHLVYGESLFSGTPLCYSDARPSSGFTSPLWLIPSALASLGGSEAGPLILMAFSLVTACTILFLLAPLTSALLLLAGPFLFHAASGMETALSCLMVAAVWKWVQGDRVLWKGSLILMAAFLARPDLSVLLLPMVTAMERRTPRRLAALVAPSMLMGILWVLWNFHATGLPFPSTFYAKQPVSWFTAAGTGLPGLLKGLLMTSPLLFFAAAIYISGNLRKRGRRADKTAAALIPLVLFAVSLALQPNSYFQMRYYLPAITALVMAAGSWLHGLGGRRRRLNAMILGISMVPGMILFAGRRMEASADVTHIDVLPAIYLGGIAKGGETVAAADIGAVGWITDLDILDLDGLVTPERLPGPGRSGWSFIEERADYLLAFPSQYSDLVEQGSGSLVFMEGFGSPAGVICGEDSVALWRIE